MASGTGGGLVGWFLECLWFVRGVCIVSFWTSVQLGLLLLVDGWVLVVWTVVAAVLWLVELVVVQWLIQLGWG